MSRYEALIDPKTEHLDCPLCYADWNKTGKKPLCQISTCPVEDLANDIKLNQRVSHFQRYKILNAANAPEALQVEALRKADLIERPDTLLKLENVRATQQKKERESQNNLSAHNQAHQRTVSKYQ